jgi:hypothetical protein
VPFYGAVVACTDDDRLRAVMPRMTRRVITYGLSADSGRVPDVTATDIVGGPLTMRATVLRRARESAEAASALVPLGPLSLGVPGRHNLQNALATVAVGLELGLSYDRIAAGLGEFKGAERRFEVRGEVNGILVVDTTRIIDRDRGHAGGRAHAASADGRGVSAARFTAPTPSCLRLARPRCRGSRVADGHLRRKRIRSGRRPRPAGAGVAARSDRDRRRRCRSSTICPPRSRASRPAMVITLGAGSIASVPDRLIELLAGRPADAPSAHAGGVS